MAEKQHNKLLFTKMLVLYLLLVVVVGGAMFGSIIKIQAVDGDDWRKKRKSREEIERVDPARRGTIFSSDGKVLAVTVPVCDLCLDVARMPRLDTINAEKYPKKYDRVRKRDSAFMHNMDTVCELLHRQFPAKSKEYYRDKVMKEWAHPSHCLYLERRVPFSVWETIRHLDGWGQFVVDKTGEGSVMTYVRAHIYGNMGENTIGLHYKTAKTEGYSGLEGYYDSVLRGRDGKYLCRRLSSNVWLPEEEDDDTIRSDEDSILVQRKINGKSIVATIDTRYQDIAESALRQAMNKYGGQRGCAILMEVSTGYVLACSNLTRDTNNRLSEMLWSNVACSDMYEPGSTFKTVSMVAMFNDKKISIDTSKRVRIGGVKEYGKNRSVVRHHGYAADTANLAGVLAKSSNIGMSELVWEYYNSNNRRGDFKKGLEEIFPFGRMKPDLKVTEPYTHTVDLNSDIDFLTLSFGYAATVTPLQMLTFYNALANGGKMVKPLFCREIIDGANHNAIRPVVLKEEICSKETAKQMREMLIGVVENGTGRIVSNTVYGIGGKTGTAEVKRNANLNNSSFVGFFPAENPKYTCMVLLEETSVTGAYTAAPVFKKIADCVVAIDKDLSNISPQDSERTARPMAAKASRESVENISTLLGMPFMVDDSLTTTPWVRFDSEKQTYVNYTLPEMGVVPDCKGMTVRDAMELLRQAGLKTEFSGCGKVVSQTPKARSKVEKGTTVTLELKY